MTQLDDQVDRSVARLAVHERRLQARERLSLSGRLLACEHRIMLRSSIGAKQYDSDQVVEGYESSPPPGAFTGEDAHEFGTGTLEQLLRPIRNALEALETGLDFDSGYGPGRDTGKLISEEKDAELVQKWEGVHSGLVSRLAPHLGSPRTVERARKRLGVQPVSGLPLVVKGTA